MRTTSSILRSLDGLSRKWLRREDPFRKKAVVSLSRRSGYSTTMAEAMIDALFRELTKQRLEALLREEIGDPRRLDGFISGAGGLVRVRGPRHLLHVLSATSPTAAIQSLVLGLLVKSRNTLKVSSRDRGFLPEYLASLRAHDPRLAGSCRITPKLSSRDLSADAVVVYGSDRTVEQIRRKAGPSARFIGYGHRMSFTVLTKRAPEWKDLRRLVRGTAEDVWMADQRGCLSCAVIFLEEGSVATADRFGEALARELERRSRLGPVTRRPLESALGHRRLQETHDLLRVKGRPSRLWRCHQGQWTVHWAGSGESIPVSGGQAVQIRTFRDAGQIRRTLGPLRHHLQAAALACGSGERRRWAEDLMEWGVNRITRPGRLQRPPLTWHHDGMPNLTGWLTYCDLEG